MLRWNYTTCDKRYCRGKPVLLPPTCLLCRSVGREDLDLCEYCYRELPWLQQDQLCLACGLFCSAKGEVCGGCLKSPFAFQRCYGVFSYDAASSFLVKQLKFSERLACGRVLVKLMAAKIIDLYERQALPEVIIPMPLHNNRLFRRGFNQSSELAKPLAGLLQVSYQHNLLLRVKPTAAQSSLPVKKRRANVISAFKAKASSYKHVALLDDVVTTGSTAHAAAKALLKIGVERVDVWCAVRVQRS